MESFVGKKKKVTHMLLIMFEAAFVTFLISKKSY